MRASEHYLKAEEKLAHAESMLAQSVKIAGSRKFLLQEKADHLVRLAQVHATLATATESSEKVAQIRFGGRHE